MAELEDVTLDGKPLHSLRVADLKAALEQRGLAKSGQKNALIKRLKGALMLENLQRSSTHHIGLQPNSQIGEEMSQNSFIKQYLAKQQELLRQRLEREAREATEADETHSPDGPDEDDHTPTKDSASFLAEKRHIVHSHLSVTQAGGGGLPQDPGLMGSHRLDTGPVSVSQESSDTKTSRIWHPSFPPGHEEVATPSPPRAVASLSVRVVGQPERQGLPLMMPRSQEREGTAPVEAGPAQSVLQLSRSARAAASAQVESDDDDEDDDESDDEDEWGPSSHGKKNVQAPPVHPPPAAAPQRSRRKLQPPQHIPPQPQPVHHPPPLQLRHPTPPPSPPPELSFPLPDTPKQSPHDQDEPPGLAEAAAAAPGAGLVSAQSLTRQESSSSSRSSSPEPPSTRRPGPLSLLVRKMESEGEFEGAQKAGMEGEGAMEVEEQEDGEERVQVSAQKVIGSDVLMPVPTVPPAQQDSQEIEAEKDRNVQTRNEEKEKKEVDKTSAPLRLTVSSPRRPEMFSAVPPPESLKSPSKPEQVSGLTSIPKCSKEVAMETEASTAMSESKNEEDKEVNVLKKEAPQESPKMTEESKRALKLPHTTSKEDDMDESSDHTQKEKAECHSSMSSQSSSDSDSESASSRSSSSPSQEKSSPPRQNKDEEKKIRTDVKKEKAQSSRTTQNV